MARTPPKKLVPLSYRSDLCLNLLGKENYEPLGENPRRQAQKTPYIRSTRQQSLKIRFSLTAPTAVVLCCRKGGGLESKRESCNTERRNDKVLAKYVTCFLYIVNLLRFNKENVPFNDLPYSPQLAEAISFIPSAVRAYMERPVQEESSFSITSIWPSPSVSRMPPME